MEFFEFDNSFIAGYGDQQSSLQGGDEDWKPVKGTGGNLSVTCKAAQMFKDRNATIIGTPYGDLNCIEDMPLQTTGKSGTTAGTVKSSGFGQMLPKTLNRKF